MFHLTLANVRRGLSSIGVSFHRTAWGDYRVIKRGAPEHHAYYTDDLEDAYLTGISISKPQR